MFFHLDSVSYSSHLLSTISLTNILIIVSYSALTFIVAIGDVPISLTSLIINIITIITHCFFISSPLYPTYLFSPSLILLISCPVVDFYLCLFSILTLTIIL